MGTYFQVQVSFLLNIGKSLQFCLSQVHYMGANFWDHVLNGYNLENVCRV